MRAILSRYGAWSFVMLAIAMVVAQTVHRGLSGDVYWQWAAGREMLKIGRVLRDDPFSYTLYHHPWVDDEWGYQVLLAAAIRGLGPVALWIFSAGLAAAALVVSERRLRRFSPTPADPHDGIKSGLIVILVAVSLAPFVRDRPQTLSYLLFAVTLWILQSRPWQSWRQWILVPLFWFWMCCHGSFVLGYALLISDLGWHLVAARFGEPSWPYFKSQLAVLLTAVAVSWLNPFGWAIWTYTWYASTSTVIANTITEWQSPNFHTPVLEVAIFVPLVALAAVSWRRRRRILGFDAIWTGLLLLATLESVRFLPYFALEWGMVVMAGSQGWQFRRLRLTVIIPILLALSAIVLWASPWVSAGTAQASEPVGAVDYLTSHHLHGHLLNYYVWGGYLVWRGVPVFIDGRTDFYLQDHIFQDYVAIQNLTEDAEPTLAAWNIQYVLWPPGTALSTYLMADASWRLVYESQNALLFKYQD